MTVPYAQGSDLVARYDSRIIADVCSDDGVRPFNPQSDTNVATALLDGASLINAACQIGLRYTQLELSQLTGTDQALLYRINCDLAFVFLVNRRGVTGSERYGEQYKAAGERAEAWLDKLRDGGLIFDVNADVNTALPSANFLSNQTYRTVNLVRDSSHRYFPMRREQHTSS